MQRCAPTVPLSKGVMLADEVGLGKTIEASLVIAQVGGTKTPDLVGCSSSLRKLDNKN